MACGAIAGLASFARSARALCRSGRVRFPDPCGLLRSRSFRGHGLEPSDCNHPRRGHSRGDHGRAERLRHRIGRRRSAAGPPRASRGISGPTCSHGAVLETRRRGSLRHGQKCEPDCRSASRAEPVTTSSEGGGGHLSRNATCNGEGVTRPHSAIALARAGKRITRLKACSTACCPVRRVGRPRSTYVLRDRVAFVASNRSATAVEHAIRRETERGFAAWGPGRSATVRTNGTGWTRSIDRRGLAPERERRGAGPRASRRPPSGGRCAARP